MRKKSLILLLVFALLLSLGVGCSTPAPVTPDPEPEPDPVEEPSGTLVVGIHEASGLFNPFYYSSAYDGYVVDLVFQPLIDLNFDGEYEGIVAKDWSFSDDGKSITFNLRDDIVFSDGEPLTAHDVVFTYTVLADPSYSGRYGSYVKDLVGYDEYFAGETQEFKGVEASGDYTVRFNFKEPLRVNLTNTGFPIVPKHYFGKDFVYNDTSSVEAITSNVIGSGPYVINKFEEKELVFLERNDLFSGEGYLIQDIILKFVEMTTDIVELTTGAVDLLAGQIEPQKINDARAAGKMENSYPRSGYGYIKTNNEFGATTDPKVRQALYYSFNVKEFTNNYFKDEISGDVLANVQYHPFSQISWAVDDKLLGEMTEYEFDMDKAAALLDEAGWVKNANGMREKDGEIFELKIAAMPDHDILATLIPMWERDWGQGLGIKLNIAYLEFNTILDYVIYNSDANVEEWSLFFLAVTLTTPDPHELYSSFHSSYIGNGQNNTSRYSNPVVDELLDKGKAIMDIEEAKPVYAEICKILNEEAVMMPVYANTYFDLYDPKLTNFKTSSLYNWVKAMKDAKIVE